MSQRFQPLMFGQLPSQVWSLPGTWPAWLPNRRKGRLPIAAGGEGGAEGAVQVRSGLYPLVDLHGRGAGVAAEELCIEVVDDGRGVATAAVEGSGLGISGMRERVALCAWSSPARRTWTPSGNPEPEPKPYS